MGFSKTFGDKMGDILNLIKYCEILVVVEYLVSLNINDYVAKPVLVTRKRNITGSVSFGQQIGFWFTVFNTKVMISLYKVSYIVFEACVPCVSEPFKY